MADSPGSPARADRNLLFGILALQMDFINRDQLVAAMHAWIMAKEWSLGKILCDQGALKADEHALLDALVQKHLEKHGGDVQRSLAAISSAPSVRHELAAVQDSDVQASLVHLSREIGDGQKQVDPLGTLEQADAPNVFSPLRFRILRPHARGGLGEVFVAHDGELHREVALKEIQSLHADRTDSRSRFLLEAEITGGLEHPGIVPVYSLGNYADGRPFYAMRFIKGDSLAEAIDRFYAAEGPKRDSGERLLALRSLLRRFVDVCNAIAYAHSRGVLHRDLKPGNIMLGSYGETLVVDWGLAKATGQVVPTANQPEQPLAPHSGSGSAPTVMGTAIGTPAYMSPEQAAGRLVDLGPASDVYSLGATLYHLLTSKPPFDGDAGEILRKVQKGDVVPPRSLRPEVPRALEAICLKAMALMSTDRYATPLELARDVEHWLADEPVLAYREPFIARTSRWMRRHRMAVAVAATFLLAALIASAAGVILIGQKNVEIEGKRQEALKERDRAEGNFKLARDAVEKTLTGVAENERLKESDFHDLRTELLQAAVPFYEKFVEQRSDDPALEEERGRAYGRLANLRIELGQLDAAEANFENGREVFAKLADQYPSDPVYRSAMSTHQHSLGNLLHERGRVREAEEVYKAALEIQKELAEAYPNKAGYQDELAVSHYSLGVLYGEERKAQAAEKAFLAALTIQKRLAIEYPGMPAYRLSEAVTQNGLATELSSQGKIQEAVEADRAALTILKVLVADYPKVPTYREDLAMSLGNLSDHLRSQGKMQAAEEACRASVAYLKALVEEFPKVLGYRRFLGMCLTKLGVVLKVQQKYAAAEAEYRAALKIQKALADENPRIPDHRGRLADSHYDLGILLRTQGKMAAAEEAFRTALTIQKSLVDEFQPIPQRRFVLGRSHGNLGSALFAQGKTQAAEEAYRAAVTILQQLTEEFRNEPSYLKERAGYHYNLGLLLSEGGRLKEAASEFRQAESYGPPDAVALAQECEHQLQLVERLTAVLEGRDKPKDALEQIEFASLCVKSWQGRNAAAVRFYAAAFAQNGKLAEDMEQRHRYNAACAAALAGCGKGKDADKLDEGAKAKLRNQAFEWLSADLAYWSKQAKSAKPDAESLAVQTLQHWRQDSDLAGVRGDAIAKLPAAEQAPWGKLWQEAAAVLAKTNTSKGS